jgi:hypothetical protein
VPGLVTPLRPPSRQRTARASLETRTANVRPAGTTSGACR